jgi:hypothetical protein
MASQSGMHRIVASQSKRNAGPPTMPHLRVVPPPPLPQPFEKIEDPDTQAILDEANQFAGLLTAKETGIHKLFRQLGKAGDYSKDKLGRAFQHIRLLYQLKLHVQLEQLKQRGLSEQKLNRWVVTTYKLLGFTVLTVIVIALVGYLGANVFYWFSSSWVEPTVIEPTDERVIALSAQLAQQSSTRDRIAVDLADAERIIAMHRQFLEGARQALAEDLQVRTAELNRLQQLGRSFVATRAQVKASTSVYSGLSRKRIRAEFNSHLIDRESAVTGAMQLSQLAQGNLNLAEKDLEIAVRRSDLARQTETLAAIFDHRQAGRHSLETLRTVQEIRKVETELARAIDNKSALQASLDRYNKIVKTLAEAPLLRAVDGKDAIAFVPYENIDRAKPGEPLYACYLGPLFCKKVGQVAAVLPGEMAYKHPLHNSQLRGQPLLVDLTDKRAAERKVLFAGGRPILF